MKSTLSTRDILAALNLPKVGPSTVRKLWSIQGVEGGPALLDQTQALQGKRGMPLSKANLQQAYDKADEIIRQSHEREIAVLSPADDAYPQALLDIPDYPPVIYVKGSLATLAKQNKLAVVGTREASELGLRLARKIAAELSNLDISVVSGLALGIDTAAHQGGLKGPGSTIAVLAHGLDQVAPKSNEKLAASILAENGVLLSEHEVGVIPRGPQFVARNRLQSGLSKGSIVVESGFSGGSIYQGKFTTEQNRLLFVVMPDESLPGASDFRREGGERLHKEFGARKISRLEDILKAINELPVAVSNMPNESANADWKEVQKPSDGVPRYSLLAESTSVQDTYEADLKSSLAMHHLAAARLFAQRAEALERSWDRSEQAPLELPSFAIGAVLTAVAFLEAMVNDIYLAAADGPQHSPFTDFIQTDAVANAWSTARQAPLLEKYERALEASGRPKYKPSDALRIHAADLIYLRNALVHYQPEWESKVKRHKDVEEKFSGKFPENPFVDRQQAFFPHRCLGAGCALWAVSVATDFALDVRAKLGLAEAIPLQRVSVRKKIA